MNTPELSRDAAAALAKARAKAQFKRGDPAFYLQSVESKEWQPHAWVVDAVQAAFDAGVKAANQQHP